MGASSETLARRQRPSRREEILEAALDEVAANGYGDTTLAAIAKRVGITIAALYYHFDGKMAVLTELVDLVGKSIAEQAGDVAADSVKDLIVEICARFADWSEAHGREAQLYFDRAAGVSREVEQMQRAWINQVASEVRATVTRLHPDLDDLTAGVIGLAVPVLFEEYARIWLQTPRSRRTAVRRELSAAVTEIAERMDRFVTVAASGRQ